MFKKQLVLLVFMCSFIVSAQKKYHKTHYSNGQLKEEGWIINNQKDGYWKFYYQKGTLAKEGHFKKNKPTKYWYFYRKNKSKEKVKCSFFLLIISKLTIFPLLRPINDVI